MKHLFLINPAAGKGESVPRLVAQVEEVFSGRDNYQVIRTEYAGHATELTAAAAAGGEPVRIYACGGDGTLNEVVNGAAGHDHVAITHVPLGTGNDFLKLFGEDAPRFRSVRELMDGPQASFDVMECNGRLGLDVICAGLDARVGADVHKYTAGGLLHGIWAYIAALIANVLLKKISQPMTVHINGRVWDRETTILCVCNGRHYGGGFMPVGEAMPDDGILDVLLIPKVSRLTLARVIGRYAKGGYAEYPHLIHHFRTTELRASSPELTTAVVDGEVVQNREFVICLSDKKVNFFFPAGAGYLPKKDGEKDPVGI